MKLLYEELTGEVLGAFYTSYNGLRYGFLENVYVSAIVIELELRNLFVEREVAVQVYYLGRPVGVYRPDLLVDHRLVVEIKSIHTITESDRRQLMNYLRCTDLELGLLLNYGPKPQFERVISTSKPFKSQELSVQFPSVPAPIREKPPRSSAQDPRGSNAEE